MAFSKELIRAVNNVWAQIGNDVEQCAAECGETVTHDECVESCVDADRLSSMGGVNGQAADKEFRGYVQAHGYTKALNDLCKQITPKLA